MQNKVQTGHYAEWEEHLIFLLTLNYSRDYIQDLSEQI